MTTMLLGILAAFLLGVLVIAIVLSRRHSNESVKQWKSAEKNWESASKNWERSTVLFDFSSRTWWETGKIQEATAQIRRGERVDYALCGLCGQELPEAALLLEGETGLVCSRCSPEAKAAGRGSYKDIDAAPVHESSER